MRCFVANIATAFWFVANIATFCCSDYRIMLQIIALFHLKNFKKEKKSVFAGLKSSKKLLLEKENNKKNILRFEF